MNSSNRKPAWKQNDKPQGPPPEPRICPLEVEVWNNDVEQALKVLKGKMAKDGILAELKKRRHAEKPSEKKRRKHREALKKLRKSRGRKARQQRTGPNTNMKRR
jgi:small subunit ribosomal protein S21